MFIDRKLRGLFLQAGDEACTLTADFDDGADIWTERPRALHNGGNFVNAGHDDIFQKGFRTASRDSEGKFCFIRQRQRRKTAANRFEGTAVMYRQPFCGKLTVLQQDKLDG